MFKKEEKDKFKAVPQVEIDDRLYHETAQVTFGFQKVPVVRDVGGNITTPSLYKLIKQVVVKGKVFSEIVVRCEEGLEGREVVKNQLDIEVRKELKRMDS